MKTTTLRELIDNINKEDMTITTYPNWEDLSQSFAIDLSWSNDERLKAYFIRVTYCTDTRVGLTAYFLDDEFICTEWKPYRKSSSEFRFIDEQSANKLKSYLLSLIDPPETSINIMIPGELSEEIPELFTCEYNTQILHDHGYYDGELVEIVKTRYDINTEKNDYFHSVLIKHKNGKSEKIDCKNLYLPYNTLLTK